MLSCEHNRGYNNLIPASSKSGLSRPISFVVAHYSTKGLAGISKGVSMSTMICTSCFEEGTERVITELKTVDGVDYGICSYHYELMRVLSIADKCVSETADLVNLMKGK